MYWGEDAIQIGCKKKTISEWKKLYKGIGLQESYNEEQIKEYGDYIDMIDIIHQKRNQK
jgi:hypothetical protein